MSFTTDESEIRQTIDYYSDGMRTANVESLKNAFHDQAILCGYLGDELITAPIDGLYEWVMEIVITNRVAAATIRETESHGDWIDYFHLLKVGDRWWIVSKLWDAAAT